MSTDPAEWYRNMPFVTKMLFTGCGLLTFAGNFGVFSPAWLVFNWARIWHHFEIWRLVTCVFFMGKLGFPFLINMYFLYQYSLMLETGLFERKAGDYIFMLLCCWVLLLLFAFLFDFMIVGLPLVIAILYVWCSVNADTVVSFWFGSRFKAMYLPWVLLAFNIILGGSGMQELLGIFVGHLYFFIKFKYPAEHAGVNLLETPSIIKAWFPDEAPGIATFGAPAQTRRPREEQRRDWGGGQRLGGD